MSVGSVFELMVVLFVIVTIGLSLWNMRRALPFADRYGPAILQILFIAIGLIPSLHGHPQELFPPMVLMFLWAALALVSSSRLSCAQFRVSRILAFSQLVELIGISMGVWLSYAGACYFYYGHLVWCP